MLEKAINLLESLISVPSLSRDEAGAADVVYQWLTAQGIKAYRYYNNVWATAKDFRPNRPTLLLNSHIDTVKPSPAYTFDPYTPQRRNGRIYGLGSNDAGGSVVSLATVFTNLHDSDLPYNVILALTAEEEVSGEHGVRSLLPVLEAEGIKIDMGIVGEPTDLQPAIAERGLIVLDCIAHGVTGHAARNEGVNALYKALDDIALLRKFRFDKTSSTLGDIKISVTQIEAGRQHNVVPDECRFVVDVRTTDAYTNEETEAIIAQAIGSDVKARSYRIRASVIDNDHPLVKAAISLDKTPFISPTTSDMALMPFPTLKIGPGDSARSHTADEFILENEIAGAISTYTNLLTSLKL